MKKLIVLSLGLSLLAAGCSGSKPAATGSDNNQSQTGGEQSQSQPEVKTFTVSGQNFAFSPSEIKVKKGDRIKIVFQNTGGFHDWVLDEFNAKTSQLATGQSETIEFTASMSGTFEYYCSVGKHRQMGMKGNLVVE